jgi:helicase MOV-10
MLGGRSEADVRCVGQNVQEAKSPSYFNIDEATLVKHYVQDLLSDRRLGLSKSLCILSWLVEFTLGETESQDIGVISPYKQQCAKIRKLLREEKYGGVDVKVTEDWQGQVNGYILRGILRAH